MNVLLVGAGVIGTVYGTQLAKAGHTVEVLAHGSRTGRLDRTGLRTTETTTGASAHARVTVVPDGSARPYDLILISVWAGQIASVYDCLRSLSASPVLLFFGNNPAGRRGLPRDLPGSVHLGFPGVGGTLTGDTVEYMRIPQQPTTLEVGGGTPVEDLEATLIRSGFPVSRTSDMDGWLAYHSVSSPRSQPLSTAATAAPPN